MPEEQYKEFLYGLGRYFSSVKNKDFLASIIKAMDLSYSHIDSVFTETFYTPRIFDIAPGTMRGWNLFDLSIIKETITVDGIDYYVYDIPISLYKVYRLYKSILEGTPEIPEKDELDKYNFFIKSRTDNSSELAIKKSIIGTYPDNIKFIYTDFYRVQEYKIYDAIGTVLGFPKQEDGDDYLNRTAGFWYALFSRKDVYTMWIGLNILMKFPISYEDGTVTEVESNYIKINNNTYNLEGFESFTYLSLGDTVKRFQPLTMVIFTADTFIHPSYKSFISLDDMKNLGNFRTGTGRIVEPGFLYTDIDISIGEDLIFTKDNIKYVGNVLGIENKNVKFGDFVYLVPCYKLDSTACPEGIVDIEVYGAKDKIIKYNFRTIVNVIYKSQIDSYDISLINKLKPIYSYLIWRFTAHITEIDSFSSDDYNVLFNQNALSSIEFNFHPSSEYLGSESFYEWDAPPP